MKRVIFLFSLLIIINAGFSQSAGFLFKYRISFNDKNNSPYSVSNPSAFLTQKAINRRQNQGIAINQLDIPVNYFYIDSIRNLGINIINQSRWFNSVIVSMTDTSALSTVRNYSFVKNVELVISLNKKKKTSNNNTNALNSFTIIYL